MEDGVPEHRPHGGVGAARLFVAGRGETELVRLAVTGERLQHRRLVVIQMHEGRVPHKPLPVTRSTTERVRTRRFGRTGLRTPDPCHSPRAGHPTRAGEPALHGALSERKADP
ncbi:hypothetical protein GCM10010394_25150 [Streptomyces crystallinus]|uniref:Uncharacterized protein n=1 Tax=Streptomyces crystallinus TaxID=68191 RepID=A0ABP3QPB8_9ACTN